MNATSDWAAARSGAALPDPPPARARRGAAQPTTTVELFFDLVYVFAVTQLSHLILDDLIRRRRGERRLPAARRLVGVDLHDVDGQLVRPGVARGPRGAHRSDARQPAHGRGAARGVRRARRAVRGELRRAAGRPQRRGRVAARPRATGCATCSSGWSSGAPRPACCGWPARRSTATSGCCCGSRRSRWSSPRPSAGYWLPGRGRAATTDYDIEGGHFAERCQLFIIIALGESIVVTGATASDAGLTSTVVLCLVVAFVETAALWWLYFGAAAEHSRAAMSASDDPGRLARDAYTYLHLPIVAGIIATAVGTDLLIAEPARPAARGRPGDDARRARALPARREPVPLADDREDERQAPGGRGVAHPARAARRPSRALLLGVIVAALLSALAAWELPAPARNPLPAEKSG